MRHHPLDFAGDLLGFLTRCARDYGDIVRLRLGTSPAVLLDRPNQIEQVLVTRQAEFVKYRFFWRHVTRVFGNGLLTSAGSLWQRQHALMAPAFRQSAWLCLAGRGMEEVSKRFKREMFIPDWVPTPGNRRYLATVRDLDAAAASILRSDGLLVGIGGTYSRRCCKVGVPRGIQWTPGCFVMSWSRLAGHETTALALTWTLYLLSRHPEIAARMEEEIDATLEPERLPGAADLGRLHYLGWVITEAMRLYPPVYILGREAVREVKIGDFG
jgi:cytochrome P450